MAKYEWQGSVLTVDFEVEGLETVRVDLDQLSSEVRLAAAKFGLQHALRNSTAGKMDDPAEGYKAMRAKLAVFNSGVWEKQGESRAKVELTEQEKEATVQEVIIAARRAKGDQRTGEQIITAFEGLDEDRQKAALAALKPAIDKKMKQRLQEKKKLGKVDAPEF